MRPPLFEREPPYFKYIQGVLCYRSTRPVWLSAVMTGHLSETRGLPVSVSGPRYKIGEWTYACDCWYGDQHFLAII
jgi:hypothetical protein